MTTLKELSLKYPTDKDALYLCDYIPIYENLFYNFKQNPINLLEIGIGCYAHESYMKNTLQCVNYKIGNCLRLWRDYFPNGNIYGLDYETEAMIENEDRIFTYLGYQNNWEDMKQLGENIGKLDIVIDDGSHEMEDQALSFIILRHFLKFGSLYVLQNVHEVNIDSFINLTAFPEEYRQEISDNFIIKTYPNKGFIVYTCIAN
jgi:hypothetical protein